MTNLSILVFVVVVILVVFGVTGAIKMITKRHSKLNGADVESLSSIDKGNKKHFQA